MSENESKFTNEYILKAFNCAVFLDEPACTEMREALNEMMGLKQRIATLEASLRWIPVSDTMKLPPDREHVLVSWCGRVYRGYHIMLVREWSVDGMFFHGDNYDEITHWMPLPNPPELPTPEVSE